ncbi:MAG: L-rhamnose mutarotase [Akkermansiaceae bacterium]|nr:L-rhamnose mutarotase [Akkermansiaceae bacterium]
MHTRLSIPILLLTLLISGCHQTKSSDDSGEGNPTNRQRPENVTRLGMVVGIKPEKIEEYTKLHAECWPGVLDAMKECNFRNFSIYIAEIEPGKHYLFGYLEYWGSDMAADQKKAESYEINRKWWKLTDACQVKVPSHQGDGLWMSMKEVFHTD